MQAASCGAQYSGIPNGVGEGSAAAWAASFGWTRAGLGTGRACELFPIVSPLLAASGSAD